jgi:hypothetical protein
MCFVIIKMKENQPENVQLWICCDDSSSTLATLNKFHKKSIFLLTTLYDSDMTDIAPLNFTFKHFLVVGVNTTQYTKRILQISSLKISLLFHTPHKFIVSRQCNMLALLCFILILYVCMCLCIEKLIVGQFTPEPSFKFSCIA